MKLGAGGGDEMHRDLTGHLMKELTAVGSVYLTWEKRSSQQLVGKPWLGRLGITAVAGDGNLMCLPKLTD